MRFVLGFTMQSLYISPNQLQFETLARQCRGRKASCCLNCPAAGKGLDDFSLLCPLPHPLRRPAIHLKQRKATPPCCPQDNDSQVMCCFPIVRIKTRYKLICPHTVTLCHLAQDPGCLPLVLGQKQLSETCTEAWRGSRISTIPRPAPCVRLSLTFPLGQGKLCRLHSPFHGSQSEAA